MSLPTGTIVRLAPGVLVRDGGRTLVGGAPPRVSHLGERAGRLLGRGVLRTDEGIEGALAERLVGSGMAVPVGGSLPEVPFDQVTCVVPVRDRPFGLDRLLRGLDGALRVVVVDDGSLDPRATSAVAARHGAEVLLLPENRGPAAARNAGIAAVATPFVLLVDSDVVLDPDDVSALARHLGDPAVALVAPRVLGLGGGDGWLDHYEEVRSSLDLGPRSALVRPRSAVAWVPAAALLGRVEALAGGFDVALRSGEDVDLVWRLCADGWRVRYEADVVVRHENRTRVRAWLGRKAFYGSSAEPLARRHGRTVAPAVLTPLGVVVTLAVLVQRRWSLPVAVAASGVTATRLSRRLERSGRPAALAAELTGQGVVAALDQTSGLLLRHWWPASLVACLVSSRARRAVAVAVVADVVAEHVRERDRVRRRGYWLARRLDDLAYGWGVWAGAVRAGSAGALVPDVRWRRPPDRTSTARVTGTE
ncbi:mycofactocin biosynthesis glycosyltransferase MftF [Solicola sp. PLA-1-18]|uniref:mycofactocin biosynthesis glycosyltransferase MftF n=1 Tax=Solicola sp. PLA-1-18 TaxID=3380532 RepID=UPI003B76BD84